MPKFPFLKVPLHSRHSWIYFFIFLISNTFLSYFQLPLVVKACIGAFGLILPFLLALKASGSSSVEDLDSREFLPSLPPWVWLVLAAAAISERFFELTSLSPWPLHDESLWGWMAIRFNLHGGGIFPEGANFPAGYLWGLALFFKWLKPSLFTLWFYPALLSTLAAAVGFWAPRMFFSKSLSFLMGLLLAFSFWPLYVGRLSGATVLVLLAECAFGGLLGFFLKSNSSGSRNWRAPALGVAAGVGFYIFISWAMVAFLGGLVVLTECRRRKPRTWAPLGFFGISLAVSLAPILWAGLWNSFQGYLSGIGFWSSGNDFGRQLEISLSYLTVLFWGVNLSNFTFQPVWGGFFNPCLDAFFALGLLEMIRAGGRTARWLGAAFVLLVLPGMMTASREYFRILSVLPVLIVVCGLGWRRLLLSCQPRYRLYALLALGLAFAGLDFYHLAVRYHEIWKSSEVWRGYGKSMERYRAHFLLEKMAAEQGPGLIYDGFVPGLCDQSLFVMTFPYNAAQNPSLPFQEARWGGILANVNYKPFLQKRFPQSRFFTLSEGLQRPDGGWMLWVTPVTPKNRDLFQQFQKASKAFECYPHWDPSFLLPLLQKAAPAFERDPFLKSSYEEKLADMSFRASGFKDTESTLRYLKEAVKKGYPAAHLYWRMGSFYRMQGERDGARRAFEAARQAPLNLTSAREELETLK